MNTIITKLDLPYDIKFEIYNYCYNDLGYTFQELAEIENIKNKKINKFMKLRHKLELSEWYRSYRNVYPLSNGGLYRKKDPRNVYGGGTLAETQYFRYYNGITSSCPTINDPKNNYIEKAIDEGDLLRNQ